MSRRIGFLPAAPQPRLRDFRRIGRTPRIIPYFAAACVRVWKSGKVEKWKSEGVGEWKSEGVEEWVSEGVEEWVSWAQLHFSTFQRLAAYWYNGRPAR